MRHGGHSPFKGARSGPGRKRRRKVDKALCRTELGLGQEGRMLNEAQRATLLEATQDPQHGIPVGAMAGPAGTGAAGARTIKGRVAPVGEKLVWAATIGALGAWGPAAEVAEALERIHGN